MGLLQRWFRRRLPPKHCAKLRRLLQLLRAKQLKRQLKQLVLKQVKPERKQKLREKARKRARKARKQNNWRTKQQEPKCLPIRWKKKREHLKGRHGQLRRLYSAPKVQLKANSRKLTPSGRKLQ